MNRTILVVAAHPDDEVLGCGGSIAKWSSQGDDVHILIMAEGLTSRDYYRDREKKLAELSKLAQCAKFASEILGARSVDLLDFPDNRMDTVAQLDVVKAIENKIEQLKPDMVVTHHHGDVNIDHRVVHQAVLTACRPQPGCGVKIILAFEVPSSTEWQSSDASLTFQPNWFEDISLTLEVKLRTLKEYDSEMKSWPHPRSYKAVEHKAKWRGATVGLEASEAFMLIRVIV